jgi:hypothetical protein
MLEALMKIQQELKAPKNQRNSFGNYNYRSAEDILEAVKPLLAKYGAEMTLSDDIIQVGERIYVKAVATLKSGDESCTVTAYAREPETKKGMDDSQVTGAASSYARKYALNGLFLIDDTKDADTDEYRNQQNNSPKQASKPKQTAKSGTEKINQKTVETLEALIAQTNSDRDAMLGYYNVNKLEDMTADMARDCYKKLSAKVKQNG